MLFYTLFFILSYIYSFFTPITTYPAMSINSEQILNKLSVVIKYTIYNLYLCCQLTKQHYPEFYNLIYYALIIFIFYKVLRLVVRSLYSTIKSILKGIFIIYVIYMVVNMILLLDANNNNSSSSSSEVDIEDQIVFLTTQLLQQLQNGYRLVRLLVLALYGVCRRYANVNDNGNNEFLWDKLNINLN